MWVVVYLTSKKEEAEKVREHLGREGVLVEMKPRHPVNDGQPRDYEILVPSAEARDAQSIIAELGG